MKLNKKFNRNIQIADALGGFMMKENVAFVFGC